MRSIDPHAEPLHDVVVEPLEAEFAERALPAPAHALDAEEVVARRIVRAAIGLRSARGGDADHWHVVILARNGVNGRAVAMPMQHELCAGLGHGLPEAACPVQAEAWVAGLLV